MVLLIKNGNKLYTKLCPGYGVFGVCEFGGGWCAVTYPTNILNFLDATFYQGTAYELLVL